tara:strand:+ start:2018 stop:2473 length:456 start_codon:yes stop_codon:yes gene_type:complete
MEPLLLISTNVFYNFVINNVVKKSLQTTITQFIANKLKEGLAGNNVFTRFKYMDEINDFPTICIHANLDNKIFNQTNTFGGYLTVNLRCYVHNEDAIGDCDMLLQNIEEIINSLFEPSLFEDIRIRSIDSDEGLVTPFGIADMTLEILYGS